MLWGENTERDFFERKLKTCPPNKLFYETAEGDFYAYWPKNHDGRRSTLQSRNSLIGDYSERWAAELLAPSVNKLGLYAVRGVVCEQMGLNKGSAADIAICKSPSRTQEHREIVAVVEVKMSVVWNWRYRNGNLSCIGDYKSHRGQPGLLRSDTMLKAIGKAVNIRMCSGFAAEIPILILGNTPITKSYVKKVENLRRGGVIQGIWSVNPAVAAPNAPSPHGFCQIADEEELGKMVKELLIGDGHFFSAYKNLPKLGEIIETANREKSYEDKARSFLKLIC